MKLEKWKPIKGFKALYEVSNFGNVRSLPRFTTVGRILKPNRSRFYKSVCLSKQNKFKTFTVHRLVALAFIPNKKNKIYVNQQRWR